MPFFDKVEQFLKGRQERSMDPPRTSGKLTAWKNVIKVHNQENDPLKAIHARTPSGKPLCTPQIEDSC